MKKFLISVITAASIIAGSANTYASGLMIENSEVKVINENTDYTANTYAIDNIEIESNAAAVPSAIDLDEEWTADESDFKEYYYDQLSDWQQYVYDYMNENADAVLTSENPITIELPEKLYFNMDESIDDNIFSAVQLYFNYDHAEKFGYNINEMCYDYENYQDNEGNTIVTALYISFGCYTESEYNEESGEYEDVDYYADTTIYGYDSYDDIISDQKTMEAVINKILETIPENASRYRKLQIINDWLVDNNSYNPYVYLGEEYEAYASPIAWMLTSAFIYGSDTDDYTKHPICEGYSEAFKYLCDKLDIPCVSVSSASHKWNEVQMDDGNWYFVDVTWNDPLGTTTEEEIYEYRYKYFLIGSETLAASDEDDDHVISLKEEHNVSAPAACTADYTYEYQGDLNDDYVIDNEDAALMLKYISGIETLTDAQKNIGDMDKDGKITLADAVQLLKTIQ